jgi:putative PIN family toxin of toxin-antitoxin system
MRLVIDTNVLVSAMLGPGRVPDELLELILARRIYVAYDARIRAEYIDIVARPKFRAVPAERRERLLAGILGLGEEIPSCAPYLGALKDEDDRMFVEVALAAGADALVTGNLKDYPTSLGFLVLPPATALAELLCPTTMDRTSSS